jgi:hypothetical protein
MIFQLLDQVDRLLQRKLFGHDPDLFLVMIYHSIVNFGSPKSLLITPRRDGKRAGV